MPRIRTHPGEVLFEEYMKPLGLSGNAVGKAIGVPPNRINDLVRKRRGMTGDTALRLGRYFVTTPAFWMNLQSAYDISVAESERGAEIEKITAYA